MPFDRFRFNSLMPLLLGAGLLLGCAKQDEESQTQPAPSNTSNSETDTPGPENSTAPKESSQPVGPSVQQIPSELDLSYITDDFTGAIIVHPARFLSWDLFQQAEKLNVPIDEMVKELRRRSELGYLIPDFGVDLRNIEQVIVLLDRRTASSASAVLPPPLGERETEPLFPVEAAEEIPLERPLNGGPDPSLIEEIETEPETGVVDESEVAEFELTDEEKRDFPFFTVIFRFRDEKSAEQLVEMHELASIEFVELNGLRVKRVQEGEFDVVFHPVDTRTLVLTRTRFIEKMMKNQSAYSPLIAELNRVDPSHDFIFVTETSPFRKILARLSEQLSRRIRPDLSPLATAPLKAEMLTLTAGLHDDSLFSVGLIMGNANDATSVNGLLSKVLEQGRQVYQVQRAMFARAYGSIDNTTRVELEKMTDQIIEGTSSVAEGQRLTLTVPTPKNFDQLVTILTPALESASRAAELARRKNKMKMIGLAFHNYHDVYGKLPGAGSDASGMGKGLSWRVHLLPFLDHAPLYDQFHLDEPWDSAHNKTLIQQMPDVFKSSGVDEPGMTSCHMFVGKNAYSEVGGTRFREITDGLSNTLMAVEAGPDNAEIWTKPGGLKLNPSNPIEALGALEEDFFLALFADGRVRQIPTSIDAKTLKALITINGGETVRDF